jgi:hypothetical protein
VLTIRTLIPRGGVIVFLLQVKLWRQLGSMSRRSLAILVLFT